MAGSWIKLRDKVKALLSRKRGNGDDLSLHGTWHIKHYRKGELIAEFDQPNLITTEGRNRILDVMFHGTSATATWYIGLVDNDMFTAFNAADVMNSHGGWIELEDYDEAARQTWAEDAAASGAITNSTPAAFTISDTVVIKGIFLTSVSTKGGTTGVLWCGTAFSSNINAEDDDVLSVTYTVNTA
jgi:hypothetical protein